MHEAIAQVEYGWQFQQGFSNGLVSMAEDRSVVRAPCAHADDIDNSSEQVSHLVTNGHLPLIDR